MSPIHADTAVDSIRMMLESTFCLIMLNLWEKLLVSEYHHTAPTPLRPQPIP